LANPGLEADDDQHRNVNNGESSIINPNTGDRASPDNQAQRVVMDMDLNVDEDQAVKMNPTATR
jgi:hypothetical protein